MHQGNEIFQKGFVLVTVLVFLMIISISGASLLRNLSSYFYAEVYSFQSYREIYQLERELELLEQELLLASYSQAGLDNFLSNRKILVHPEGEIKLRPALLWSHHPENIIQNEQTEYLLEYLGPREIILEKDLGQKNENETEQELDDGKKNPEAHPSEIFRVTMRLRNNEHLFLQSWLQCYSQDTRAAFLESGKQLAGKRIAWFEFSEE